jgi:hypothetical protein
MVIISMRPTPPAETPRLSLDKLSADLWVTIAAFLLITLILVRPWLPV